MEAQNAVREREKVLNEEVSRLREELERQKVSQTAVIEQGRKSFSFSEIEISNWEELLLDQNS